MMADDTTTDTQNTDTGADPGAGADAAAGDAGGDGGASGAPAAPVFTWDDVKGSVQDQALKATVDRFGSFDEMAGAVNKLRTEVSDRIRIPGPKATPEDLAKFRKAMGVPESAEGYAVKMPENVALTDADKVIVEMLKPLAHEANIPQAAFERFISAAAEANGKIREETLNRIKQAQTQTVEELKKEWATAYDANVELAKRAAKAHGSDKFNDFLNTAVLEGGGVIGDHPEMIRFLQSIGRRSDESDLFITSSGVERDTAQQELQRILKETPPGTEGYRAADVQARVAELNKVIHGTQPVVGGGGRTV